MYRNKYQEFVDILINLFDIAKQNALITMTIEEDKIFLLKQREKGRPGSMIGVDQRLNRQNIKNEKQKEQSENPCTSNQLLEQEIYILNYNILDDEFEIPN